MRATKTSCTGGGRNSTTISSTSVRRIRRRRSCSGNTSVLPSKKVARGSWANASSPNQRRIHNDAATNATRIAHACPCARLTQASGKRTSSAITSIIAPSPNRTTQARVWVQSRGRATRIGGLSGTNITRE